MKFGKGDRIVLKFGTECLKKKDSNRVDEDVFLHICEKTAELYKQGYFPIIVTSGAVFMGMEQRGLEKRPEDPIELQSLAARGQPSLMSLYEHHLKNNGLGAAQIIVTHRDLRHNKYRQNLVEVANKCYANREIPIFNENDAISNEELKKEGKGKSYYFDDNDMLSFLIARYFEAKCDIMFNQRGGLYDNQGNLIEEVHFDDFDSIDHMVKDRKKSSIGRGGLVTKLKALQGCTKEDITGIMVSSSYITDKNISFLDIINQGGLDRTIFYPAEIR